MINAVRAELLKMRSMPGIWVCFGLAFPLTALFVWAIFAASAASPVTPTPSCTPSTERRQLLGAGYFGIMFLAPVLGVICITSEYRHKTIDLDPRPHPSPQPGARGENPGHGLVVPPDGPPQPGGRGRRQALPWNAALGGVTSQVTDQVGAVVPGLVVASILLGLFGWASAPW